MTVFVTKADGTRQPFDKWKVVRTCLRMGATLPVAELIAEEIETRIYDGIETKKILQMIFKRLRKHKPVIRHQIDLRKALSLLNPAPDFERFIQLLLSEHDYEVTPNQIVRGRCVEHEVDAVARKNGKTCIVEVKHHFKYHTPTSLDVSRISRAVFEDVTEGYELGLNNLKIDYAMIVCNTKLSEHAKRYADCRGIRHIGWSSPPNHDLQTMIEEKKLYPITFLKGLNAETRNKLASNGIILLKRLTEKTPKELRRQTGISKEKLGSIVGKARAILSEN
ncbi:MAG: ATP cone domain-containing protein [Candidatus Bathyarchaeota archaeon]|nr:ATP cone domain-containing protein [Candidatus Bathyarchaeota archaeon]